MGTVSTMINMAIGAAITWFVTYRYYRRAATDLTQETEKLRKLHLLIIRALEEGRIAKFNFDEKGNPIGLVIQLSTHESIAIRDVVDVRLKAKNSP